MIGALAGITEFMQSRGSRHPRLVISASIAESSRVRLSHYDDRSKM